MTSLVLIRDVEILGRAGRADVVVRDGVIDAVAPAGTGGGAALVVTADGGSLIPGLHDHHLHLAALAASRRSIDVGPPAVTDAASFDRTVAAAAAAGTGWLRAVGFHESVAGSLDRDRLDALVGGRRVRVQHRTGAMWVLSSAALEATGIGDVDADGVERDADGRPTGRLYGLDTRLRERLPADRAIETELDEAAAMLARHGVTGVTDLTPSEDAADLELLARVAARPGFPLRVHVTGGVGLPDDAAPALPRGPVKLVVGDHALPALDDLVAGMRAARRRGRTIAVHVVTRVGLVLALAAWDEVGVEAGDRLEHGAVIPAEVLAGIRERGLIVVTQPSFVHERGDQYLRDVDPDDVDALWRCGSLDRAGIGLAGSTDAPFGHPDPWRAMVAAVDRRTRGGRVLGAGERVTPRRALGLFLTTPLDPAGAERTVTRGAAADLVLLDRPLADVLADPRADHVVATFGRAGPGWIATDRVALRS